MNRNEKARKIKINGAELKVGVVVAQFNRDITESLARGAVAQLKAHGVRAKNITVIRVPGGVEVPLGCEFLAKTNEYDGLVAVACVIKGETAHDYFVALAATQGVGRVSLDHSLPIGFAVITTNNLAQAKERAKGKNNKGAEAARAMLMMVETKEKMQAL